MTEPSAEVVFEVHGRMGMVSLNRPKALNALSLPMIRALAAGLHAWRDNPQVLAVAIRGMSKSMPSADGSPVPAQAFGVFCAGGDIRYFHQAVLAGDPSLESFFTEEYQLNYLIHTYPKPFIAVMDGVVMGGGMGIAQGGSVRIVTERTKMAMPETQIGLFPDVGGGYFLSRCPGFVGEYLALSGVTIGGRQAVAWGLADGYVESQQLPKLWAKLAQTPLETGDAAEHWIATQYIANYAHLPSERGQIDQIFSLATVEAMLSALDAIAASGDDTIASTSPHHGAQWASQTATALRKRSPLLLKVTLAQIRKGRAQGLADTLRMERDMVYHCFRHRPGAASETMEGIRAQVIDKDLQPRWNPATLAEVSKEAVNAFFASPWPAQQHPLAALHR